MEHGDPLVIYLNCPSIYELILLKVVISNIMHFIVRTNRDVAHLFAVFESIVLDSPLLGGSSHLVKRYE